MTVKLTIRDVEETTRDVLAARAAQRRQSLSSYIVQILDREAHILTMNEALDRIALRPRVHADSEIAVDVLRELRDGS